MITLGSFQFVSDARGSWLDCLRKRKESLAEGGRKAISACLLALNETELHWGRVDGARSQADLSRLWMTAADTVREYNHDLARRCSQKARAWWAPDDLSGADIASALIGIAEMARAGEDLLGKAGQQADAGGRRLRRHS